MEDWKWETKFYGHYRSIFNHCDIIGLQSYQIPWKKCKIRSITPFRLFKVIKVGTSRKPVCDFLLVINSNWNTILYHFRVIAAYCSKCGHLAFLSPPLGGLGTTYDVHLELIGKRVVDFLWVLIELFSLGVTDEVLWAKIDWKSAILLQHCQFDPKFQVEGDAPHQSFLHR